jgi:hypothetical protein
MIANLVTGLLAPAGSLAPTSPVAGYTLWLDAADTATISLSGSAVTQWTDKSASAYTFTQATGANQPVSGTTTQNSKNVMVFNTNDSLAATSAASVWKFLSDGSTYTVMMACKTTDAVAQQIALSTYSGSGASIGVSIGTETTNNINHGVLRNVSGSPAVQNNSANNVLTTSFTYISVLGDPNNATAANRSDIRAKQGSAIKNNSVTFSPSTSNPYQSLRVGDYIQGGAVGWIGQIGEILIYTSILSASDLLLNQQYLANKWGV